MWGRGRTSENNKIKLKKKFEKYHVPDTHIQAPRGYTLSQSQKCDFGFNLFRKHHFGSNPEQPTSSIQNLCHPCHHLRITIMVQPIPSKKTSNQQTPNRSKSRSMQGHWNIQDYQHRSTFDPRFLTTYSCFTPQTI